MAALQDIVVEGVTTFASPPATSYRYVIELKSDKLSVWMEDRTTKKQWCKSSIAKADFVSSANAIPGASTADYVQCIQDSLSGDLDDSSDVKRSLSALSGGGLRLSLAVTIRVLRSTWVAKYSFDLDLVSVERIDVLESKLCDLQEELGKLRGRLRGGQAPPYINLTATEKYKNLVVCWNAAKSDEFVSSGLNGVVKVLRDGVYRINATVTSPPEDNCTDLYWPYQVGNPWMLHSAAVASTRKNIRDVQLQKNGKPFQATCPGYSKSCKSSAYLNTIERLEKNDKVTVSSTCAIVDTSYFCMLRLGD